MLSLFVVFLVIETKKAPNTPNKPKAVALENLLLNALGISLFAVIFFKINRIMGFYLFPGSILLVLGLFSSCEELFKTKLNTNGSVAMNNILKAQVPALFITCLFGITLFFWLPQNLKALDGLANRTKTPDYKINYSSFLQINDFLTFYSKEKNRKIYIKNIGSPFVPKDTEYFSIQELWRPFVKWDFGFEALLVKDIGNVSIEKIKPSFLNYNSRVEEKRGYDRCVINPDESCPAKECYKRIKTFENGTEFLVLTKNKN